MEIPGYPDQMISSKGRRRARVWKDIPGPEFEGYQASDFGDIRSLDKTVTTSAGVVKQLTGKVLNPTPPKPTAPYRMVTINGKNYRVAPLILTTFVRPKPFPKAMARHLDDDKSNDMLDNLAWGSKSQNTKDSILNLTYNRPWRYRQKGGSR
jgi:hypothetical protein